MIQERFLRLRSIFLLLATILFAIFNLPLQHNDAFAQVNYCQKLSASLRSLERNKDYRSYKRNSATYQKAAKELKQQESLFVRGGCQRQLNAGQKLSSQCRTLAKRILKARPKVERLKNSVETGQLIARKREQILQQIAARGCNSRNSNSRLTITNKRNNQGPQTLFDILFGNKDIEIRADDDFAMQTNLPTIRTVCVRSCDGFFWPISFSTIPEYLYEDAEQCQIEGKGADVELYYYRNPGETIEEMVSISGVPYKSSPNAFRYKDEYDRSCTIKKQTNLGFVTLVQNRESTQTRMMINIEGISFPMPLRDPRLVQELSVKKANFFPLPRPRPLRAGEENMNQISNSNNPTIISEPLRIVSWRGKIIRIVGPDTPYAQLMAKGT